MAGVSLFEDPQVVAALISFATVGVALVHQVWCRRRRFVRVQKRWPMIVEADTPETRAGFPFRSCQDAEVVLLPVLLIKDASK